MRKLVDNDIVAPGSLHAAAMPDGEYGPSFDDWGSEIQYPPPAPGAAGTPLIRSMGANGVDEAGAGDDLTHCRGINPGSYWKRYYATGWRRVTVFASAIAMLAACAPFVGRRIRRVFLEIGLVVCGVGLGVSMPFFSPSMWSSRPGHNMVAEWSCIAGRIALLGVVAKRACITITILLPSIPREPGAQCPACGYDLTGTHGPSCPECGSSRSSDAVSSRP